MVGFILDRLNFRYVKPFSFRFPFNHGEGDFFRVETLIDNSTKFFRSALAMGGGYF